MKEIIENVILAGKYELSDILKKIDTIWLQGDLTDEEHSELIILAQENAKPENSYAPLQQQVKALFENLEEIAGAVKNLQEKVAKLDGGETTSEPEPEEYPEWRAWDGIPPCPWQNESKCTHKDKKWMSHVDDNIWEPGAEGVHSNIWEEIAE